MKEEYRKVIEEYNKDYSVLIKNILKYSNDFDMLCSFAKDIEEKFIDIFKWNNKNMYNNYMEVAPKMIIALLTREKLREYMDLEDLNARLIEIGKKEMENSTLYAPYIISFDEENMEYRYMRYAIREIMQEENYTEIEINTLGDVVELEKEDTEVLLLNVQRDTRVYNRDNLELYAKDINGKFLHMRGLKCITNKNQEILYIKLK